MVQIIGRLTGDAEIKTVHDKEVVNFTIAINDYYKPKGRDEAIEHVEFIQCAYWFATAVAASLKKGAMIEAGGRLFATAYMKGDDPKGQINMQVQHIKVHMFAKKDEPQPQHAAGLFEESTQVKESNGKPGKPANPKSNKPKSKTKSESNHVPGGTTDGSDDLPF